MADENVNININTNLDGVDEATTKVGGLRKELRATSEVTKLTGEAFGESGKSMAVFGEGSRLAYAGIELMNGGLKELGDVIIENPIFLLAAVIAGLVIAMIDMNKENEKIAKDFRESEKAAKEFGEVVDNLGKKVAKDAADLADDIAEHNDKILLSNHKISEEEFEANQIKRKGIADNRHAEEEAAKEREKLTKDFVKDSGQAYQNMLDAKEQYDKEVAKGGDKLTKETADRYNKAKKEYKELLETNKQGFLDIEKDKSIKKQEIDLKTSDKEISLAEKTKKKKEELSLKAKEKKEKNDAKADAEKKKADAEELSSYQLKLKTELELDKAKSDSNKEDIDAKIKVLDDEEMIELSNVKLTGEERVKIKEKYILLEDKLRQDALDKEKKNSDKEKVDLDNIKIKELKDKEDLLKATGFNSDEKIKIIDQETELRIDAINHSGKTEKEKIEEIKQAHSDAEKEKTKIAEEEIKKRGDILKEVLSSTQTILSDATAIQKQNEDQELADYNERSNAKVETLNTQKDNELNKEGLTADQKTAINNKYAIQEYQIKLATYNRNLQIKKKEFEQGKKMAIASALIAGALGVVNALGATPFYPMAIIGMAMATITTVLSVAKIASQKFDGGGSPPQPPSIQNVSGSVAGQSGGDNNGGSNFQAPTFFGLGQGGPGYGSTTPTQKVYVVETDITRTQNRVATIETRATQRL